MSHASNDQLENVLGKVLAMVFDNRYNHLSDEDGVYLLDVMIKHAPKYIRSKLKNNEILLEWMEYYQDSLIGRIY